MNSPANEYTQRREARLKVRAEREHVHLRVGNLKLSVIVAGLILAWFSLIKNSVSGYWLVTPAAVYAGLAVWHELVIRARTRAERAAEFYARGLARVEDRWAGTGETGERFRDAKHVYADDLDLFGRGGLFELLSSARTPMGEDSLAAWLLAPSPVAAIRERHELLAELRDKIDLREDVALKGEGLRAELNPTGLAAWAERRATLSGLLLRGVVAALAILCVAAIVVWAVTSDVVPLLITLLINLGVYAWLKRRADATLAGFDCNEDGLLLFAAILKRMEGETFASARLRHLQGELKNGDAEPASHAIRRLARMVTWIDARESYLMKLLELPVLYSLQVGFAAEAWRRRWGQRVRAWISVVGEMEALLSLAAYAYEHPADPFPEIAEGEIAGAHFAGEELGHPLIAAAQCVRNSVRLNAKTRVLLLSGSNMSGKSTLLRTVGINLALAMAGAPIRGKSLRLSPLALGTRIRGTDSLQEGRSNFYTEILRIRQVFTLAEREMPLLFLFDELLEGTNSHDRRIGAEALLRALVSHNAIGMVTTHDLALTEVAATLDGAARNVHFEDQIANGEMSFDYKLRDGIVPKSNALELMRWIGLKV
ncbi:MAG: MutS-related protein [Candidatus Acidiferrales bacterium]